MQLCGCENEHQVFGRLLQDLEQRVEGRSGQHVHLVHDIDAFFHCRRAENRFLSQSADIVHTVVGGGVELYHVEYRALADAAAGRAHPAGVAVDRVFAVDRLGQDAGAGGLSRSAGADENIGMGEAAGLYLVLESLRNVLLPHDLVKGLRTPLAVKRLIHPLPSPRNLKLWPLTRLHTRL